MYRLAALVLVAILGATANESGNIVSTTLRPPATNDSGLLWESATGNSSGTRTSGSCYWHMNAGGGRYDQMYGCPEKIPIVLNKKIVAGVIWDQRGNDISQLACNGKCFHYYAETMYTKTNNYFHIIGSMMINPGCTLYVFPHQYYGGTPGRYGPGHYPNVATHNGFYNCGAACYRSILWTCKQTYPTCTPSDRWETITELDNSESSVSSDFTYEKHVGTIFSSSMTESMSVSTEVSASISAEFWGITASMGVSFTTGYNWAQTDTRTKSKLDSYTVSVRVPPKTKVQIQNAVGTCGGSKIVTQMFKVIDTGKSRTGEKVLAKYDGQMTSYVVPGKHVRDHPEYDTSTCNNGDGADYSGTRSKTVSGRTCQKWSSQSPHKHGFGALGNHNYCRNPNKRDGVWCYTDDRRKKWEFCSVPICG